MKKLLLIILALGVASPMIAQEIQTEELSEVVVMPVNYRYLDQIGQKTAPVPVKQIQQTAADYDIKSKNYFEDDYNLYTVSFYIPDGKLVAVYDHEGKIIRTIEKFKNVDMPRAVVRTLKNEYPDWELVSDVYKVTYNETEGAVKRYKLKLQKGNKSINVKMCDQGKIY